MGDFDLTLANSHLEHHTVRSLAAERSNLFVGNDNSPGKEFIIFDTTNLPTLNMQGTLDLDGHPEDIAIEDQYAEISSSSDNQELQVIDMNDINNPFLNDSANLAGMADGLTNDIDPGRQLLALGRQGGDQEDDFYVFDVSEPDEPEELGSITLNDEPDLNDLKIVGDKVYIAAVDPATRAASLGKVDIFYPEQPDEEIGLGLNCQEAISLAVTDYRVYVGCDDGSGDNLFVVNISNPIAPPMLLSSTNVPNGIIDVSMAVDDNLLFLLTNDLDRDFQVWDVSNDLAPTSFFYDIIGTPTSAAYDSFHNVVFIGLSSDPEIQILGPS